MINQSGNLFSSDLDHFHVEGEQLISDEMLVSLWESVPEPAQTKTDFSRAIRIWAGVYSRALSEEIADIWPSKEREHLKILSQSGRKIIEAGGQYLDALTAITDGADAGPSVRLGHHLGTLDHKELRNSASMLEQVQKRLRAIIPAAEAAMDEVQTTVTKASPLRTRQKKIKLEALGSLAALWVWAVGKRKFGEDFSSLAQLSLSTILGQQDAAADIDDNLKIVRSDFNKDPNAYVLSFLD